MTRVAEPLGAYRSEVWEQRLPVVDSSTWMQPAISRVQPAPLLAVAIALQLSMSSPLEIPAVPWAKQFPQSSSVRPTEADVIRVPLRVLPGTAEQLAAIQRVFGLNKTQLADVCNVQRQTIYDWFGAKFEAEGDNARRLAALYQLAHMVRAERAAPLAPKAVERTLNNGGTLLDLLRAPSVDTANVREAVAQISAVVQAQTGINTRAQRERLGWRPLGEEERAAQLESNLDDILGG